MRQTHSLEVGPKPCCESLQRVELYQRIAPLAEGVKSPACCASTHIDMQDKCRRSSSVVRPLRHTRCAQSNGGHDSSNGHKSRTEGVEGIWPKTTALCHLPESSIHPFHRSAVGFAHAARSQQVGTKLPSHSKAASHANAHRPELTHPRRSNLTVGLETASQRRLSISQSHGPLTGL